MRENKMYIYVYTEQKKSTNSCIYMYISVYAFDIRSKLKFVEKNEKKKNQRKKQQNEHVNEIVSKNISH